MKTLPTTAFPSERFTSGERLKLAPPPVIVNVSVPAATFSALVPLIETETSKPAVATRASRPSAVAWLPLIRMVASRPKSFTSAVAVPPVSVA